jgi:N-acetylglucosaminyldiphosphoundecaprenol N-acetyl-beta-D-mannosaminyltransferase
VCKWAQLSNKKIFLLGGNSLSNEMSVRILSEKYRGLKIFGFSPDYSPYPFPEVHNERIMSKLEECAPDILFVGFGMGKQEYWADDNIDRLEKIGIKMIVGCGGTFDFISGRIKRAPKFVQNIGLEGLWRLIMEMKWFRIKRLLLSLKIIPLYIRCHVIKNR